MVKADIDTAHPQDCLLGRGHSLWPGNMRYRQIISNYRADYERATKNKEKKLITIKIVDEVCKNGGRFLKEDPISGSLTQVSKASARLRVGQALRHQLRSSRGDVDDSASSISQAAKKQSREQEGVTSLPIDIISFQDEPKAKEESPTVVPSTPKGQETDEKIASLRSIFDDQEVELLACDEETLNEDLEPTPIRNLPLSVSSVSMKDDSMQSSLETSRKNNAPILPYSPISTAHQQQQHQNQKDTSNPITTIEQLVYSGNIAEALLGQLRNQELQGSSAYSSSASAMAFPRHYANSASYYPSFDQESSQQQDESNNLALAASLLQSSIGEWS